MSVVGESTAVFPVSCTEASIYSARLHEVEVPSWLESSRQSHSFERRRYVKRKSLTAIFVYSYQFFFSHTCFGFVAVGPPNDQETRKSSNKSECGTSNLG